jgi:hypothetical protein
MEVINAAKCAFGGPHAVAFRLVCGLHPKIQMGVEQPVENFAQLDGYPVEKRIRGVFAQAPDRDYLHIK